jgi:hypothetical protein
VKKSRSVLTFWLPVMVLIVLVPAIPWAASAYFDLDERTPQAIAEDTLNEKYGLQLVDAAGAVLPSDAVELTVSLFDLAAGATTEDVPFSLDGQPVLCTVHMSSDANPRDVTAKDCRPGTPPVPPAE